MMHPYFIVIPLFTAFLITMIGGKRDLFASWASTAATAALLVMSIVCFFNLHGRTLVYEMGKWPAPFGIVLVLDSFSVLMLIVIFIMSLASLFYSMPYLQSIGKDWKYYALFLLMLTGMTGVVITGDIASPAGQALLRAAHADYRPDLVVLGTTGLTGDKAHSILNKL